MLYTFSYSSYSSNQAPLKTEFGGSSKYSVIDGKIITKAKPRTEPNTTKNFEYAAKNWTLSFLIRIEIL